MSDEKILFLMITAVFIFPGLMVASPAMAADTIKIGLMCPITGPGPVKART